MGARALEKDVEKLLQACRPSRLDGLVRKICPKYKSDRSPRSLLYQELHDLVVVLLLAKLRAAGIDAEAEISIKHGVVDILVRRNAETVAIVEVKTGNVKLIQSAIYSYITGKPVFIVETKTGAVTKLTPEMAVGLIELFIRILKDIKEIRSDTVIPNPGCRYCAADCSYGNGKNSKAADPAENILKLLNNIDAIVEELIAKLKVEIESENKHGVDFQNNY